MTRKFTGTQLVLATHNAGKAAEIAALLKDYVPTFTTAAALNLIEPDETETTFIGNASLKAVVAAMASGIPALADDSGLAVTALNGAPGIYSARWAGPDKNFATALARVERELGTFTDRSATFVCALALAWPDGHVETVEGRVDGTLIFPARGEHGFGYDPIFIPIGHHQTFAEMPAAAKQADNHRVRAFTALVEKVFTAEARRRGEK